MGSNLVINKEFTRVVPSPLGPLTLVSNDTHLIGLKFGGFGGRDDTPLLQEAERQLTEYFSGRQKDFFLPLHPEGTAFQQRVWTALQKIPYGTSWSYKQLAQAVGSPKGFRAVGAANRVNPLPIFIPCHRVIQANGSLGGYAFGLPYKAFLLQLEGCSFSLK